MSRLRRAAAPLVVLALALAAFAAPAAHAANAIETTYKAAGPWAISNATVTNAGGTVIYRLTYPTNLGAGGVTHPIVTWGNGSGAVPTQYAGVINQLASWGYVVVASTSTATGKGNEILAGAQYMVAQNANAASPFFNKLDTTKVGAIGHSQGAGGVVNATNHSAGLIKSVVPIALPATIWVSPGDEYYPNQLTVPVLFLGGSTDIIISSPSTITGFYNQVPGAAARAVLKGAGHNTIQGTGGGFLGYITAWFRYTLNGDATARAAFVGSPPEINTNTAWQTQAEKNLP